MSDVDFARHLLESEGLAFALVREGKVLARGHQQGVIELLTTVDQLGSSVRGSSLADKVVGKAVALIVADQGIRSVYATLASHGAVAFLRAQGIPLAVHTVVPMIVNRRGDGPCPMEAATLPFDHAPEGMSRLRAFFAAQG